MNEGKICFATKTQGKPSLSFFLRSGKYNILNSGLFPCLGVERQEIISVRFTSNHRFPIYLKLLTPWITCVKWKKPKTKLSPSAHKYSVFFKSLMQFSPRWEKDESQSRSVLDIRVFILCNNKYVRVRQYYMYSPFSKLSKVCFIPLVSQPSKTFLLWSIQGLSFRGPIQGLTFSYQSLEPLSISFWLSVQHLITFIISYTHII